MAFADLSGRRIYYRLEGRPGRPVMALCHVLGLDHSMWDPQVPDLMERFRVLRYDLRGHGASDAPDCDYSVADLGRDALALLDALGIDRVIWCGQSIGGMVGQWLAINVAGRLSHLILANTTPRVADPPGMEARRKAVLEHGVPPSWTWRCAGSLLRRRRAEPAARCVRPRDLSYDERDGIRRLLCRDPRPRSHGDAGADSTPTLVISGDADESMTFEGHGAVLARRSPGPRWFDSPPRTSPVSNCRARSRAPCSNGCRRGRQSDTSPD